MLYSSLSSSSPPRLIKSFCQRSWWEDPAWYLARGFDETPGVKMTVLLCFLHVRSWITARRVSRLEPDRFWDLSDETSLRPLKTGLKLPILVVLTPNYSLLMSTAYSRGSVKKYDFRFSYFRVKRRVWLRVFLMGFWWVLSFLWVGLQPNSCSAMKNKITSSDV